MVTKKNYVIPKVDAEFMTPGVVRLVAFTEGLVSEANAVQEEIQKLEAELAELQKAKRHKAPGRK